jgi:hypothetical protein
MRAQYGLHLVLRIAHREQTDTKYKMPTCNNNTAPAYYPPLSLCLSLNFLRYLYRYDRFVTFVGILVMGLTGGIGAFALCATPANRIVCNPVTTC